MMEKMITFQYNGKWWVASSSGYFLSTVGFKSKRKAEKHGRPILKSRRRGQAYIARLSSTLHGLEGGKRKGKKHGLEEGDDIR